MLIASLISVYTSSIIVLGAVSLVSFAAYIYMFSAELSNYSPFAGYANWITLFRVIIISFICVFWQQLALSTVLLISVIGVLLDWLDGFLARKLNLTSEFGLYLDMEADAFLVSVVSIILWISYDFHWIILLSGLLRYPYAVLLLFINGGNKKEPKRFYASFITGFFYISLLLAFLSQSTLAEYILYSSSILIILSFSRSLYFQIAGN